MDGHASDIPSKKARPDIDYTQCLICQGTKRGSLVYSPAIDSYEKELFYIRRRAEYGDG